MLWVFLKLNYISMEYGDYFVDLINHCLFFIYLQLILLILTKQLKFLKKLWEDWKNLVCLVFLSLKSMVRLFVIIILVKWWRWIPDEFRLVFFCLRIYVDVFLSHIVKNTFSKSIFKSSQVALVFLTQTMPVFVKLSLMQVLLWHWWHISQLVWRSVALIVYPFILIRKTKV